MFSENYFSNNFIGDDSKEDTPVPIPNTEVKLFYGEDSVSENSKLPIFFVYFYIHIKCIFFIYLYIFIEL